MKAEGVELPTYIESLLVAETERLRIRRFYKEDLIPLWQIMKNPFLRRMCFFTRENGQ